MLGHVIYMIYIPPLRLVFFFQLSIEHVLNVQLLDLWKKKAQQIINKVKTCLIIRYIDSQEDFFSNPGALILPGRLLGMGRLTRHLRYYHTGPLQDYIHTTYLVSTHFFLCSRIIGRRIKAFIVTYVTTGATIP